MRVRLALLTVSVLLLAAAPAGSATKPVRALRVDPMPARRFFVGLFNASGRFPQVAGRGVDLRAVNAGLLRAIRNDQRRYVRYSPLDRRRYSWLPCTGTYWTNIARGLISASTVVVSAMLPADELASCGNDGRTWVSMTVLVPSGRRVALRELFKNEHAALPRIARAWKAHARRVHGFTWMIVRFDPGSFGPRRFAHAAFALTKRGLALGFPQEGPTSNFYSIVRYPILRPYLSRLGRRLVAGVRRPRFGAGILGRGFRARRVPQHVHHTFRTTGKTPVLCDMADDYPRLGTFLRCTVAPTPATTTGVELKPPRDRPAVCHGSACSFTVPEGARVLHRGESIWTSEYFCVAVGSDVYCQGDARGFRLGPDGYARLKQ